MARKTKEEACKTRAAIIQAAEKCFYAQGVVRTSLQVIAETAGVTRGAVYWHFKDKVALLLEIADNMFLPHEELLERLVRAELDSPLEDLHKACRGALKNMMHNVSSRRILVIIMQRCEYIDEMEALSQRNQRCHLQMHERIVEIFKKVKRKKGLAACWTPKIAAGALQNMIKGIIETEMEWPRPSAARDRINHEIIDAFFKALRA